MDQDNAQRSQDGVRSHEFDPSVVERFVVEMGAEVEAALSLPYETKWKADNTPVTEIDELVSRGVTDFLRKAFPQDGIYNEEEERVIGTSGFTWVLDPIDGTQALGMLPTATICLSRVGPDGKPDFSVIFNPVTHECYVSDTERSVLNSESLRVSTKEQLSGSYVYLGSRMPPEFASNGTIYDALESQGAKVLNIRSLAYACALVAAGKAEGAYIGVSTPFEAAAVKLLVENAGGTVTDLSGNPPARYDERINGLIVSNGVPEIHAALVSAARRE